jgi:hypothetical protein
MPAIASAPNQYQHWMRNRFPSLNESIDNDLSGNISAFLREVSEVCEALMQDHATADRERFTYLSMIHAALYHHKKRAVSSESLPATFSSVLSSVELQMIDLASTIGVEHRFLSVFYLFYNPEIPDLKGKFAQFRPSEYEAAFIRSNREGTHQYKIAADAMVTTFDLFRRGHASLDSITSLLHVATASFRRIAQGNAMLLKTPGGEEFKFLTQYFGQVEVAGKVMRGVNAGDQPWSYILDLVFGVNLKRAFELAFEGTPSERKYPKEIKTSADVIAYEFQSGQYLHANYLLPEDAEYLTSVLRKIEQQPHSLTDLISTTFPATDQIKLSALLHEAVKQYVAASNVHFQLAKRFVPQNTTGEQIGSAGTNIVRFLKDGLNAEREKVMHKLEARHPNLLAFSSIETV